MDWAQSAAADTRIKEMDDTRCGAAVRRTLARPGDLFPLPVLELRQWRLLAPLFLLTWPHVIALQICSNTSYIWKCLCSCSSFWLDWSWSKNVKIICGFLSFRLNIENLVKFWWHASVEIHSGHSCVSVCVSSYAVVCSSIKEINQKINLNQKGFTAWSHRSCFLVL